MSNDGAHRLLLAQYPDGGRDAGGTADKNRGCVAASTQNLDLTQYRPEAGALGSLTHALIIGSRSDDEVPYRDEGIDGLKRLLALQADQIGKTPGDHGVAPVQNGPDPGSGMVQAQSGRGLDQARQPVQGLNELPQVAELSETVLKAVADVAGLGVEPHDRQLTDQRCQSRGAELTGEPLSQSGSHEDIEIGGLLCRAHECGLHHGGPAVDPLLEELPHAGAGDEVGT